MSYLLSNVSNGAAANQMSPGSLSMQRLKEAAEEAKKNFQKVTLQIYLYQIFLELILMKKWTLKHLTK